MAWRIEQVQQILLAVIVRIEHGRALSADGDAAFSLYFQRVQYLLVLGIVLHPVMADLRWGDSPSHF